MKFNESLYSYLNGSEFHNGLRVNFISDGNDILVDRISFLTTLSNKSRIIHFGCADHLPLIEKKIANGTWLHKILTEVSDSCIGIDINKEAVKLVREKFGYDNVYHCDILSGELPKIIEYKQYDYIILGEIVEHLDDPVFFLKKLQEKLKGRVGKIVVTCPNAMFYRNFIDFLKYRECINTDHRFWFTPYTLAKVLHQSGARIENFYFISPSLPKKNLILKMFYKYFPVYQETILAIALL